MISDSPQSPEIYSFPGDLSPEGKPRVCIATPLSWDMPPKLYLQSLFALRRWPGCELFLGGKGNIYQMRNAAVELAKRRNAEAILFVDADMFFQADALERIVSHNMPIVGGVCRTKNKPWKMVAFARGKKTGYYRRNGKYAEQYEHIWIEPRGHGLFPIDATGGAFLYIKMEVFDKIAKPYFVNRECVTDETICDEDFLSEDLYFCGQVRDADIPIRLDLDLDLTIGHMAHAIITSDKDLNPLVLLR